MKEPIMNKKITVHQKQRPQLGLRLYIGVRFFWGSFSELKSLDIDIWIDSKPISIGKSFPSGLKLKCPDSVYVNLSPGIHHIRANSVKGEAALDTTFTLDEDNCFMNLSLNYYPKDSPFYGLQRFKKMIMALK